MAVESSQVDQKTVPDEDSMSDISELSEHDVRSIFSGKDVVFEDDEVTTSAKLTTEGRVNINICPKNKFISKLVLPHVPKPGQIRPAPTNEWELPKWLTGEDPDPPRLKIVIQIVGSRGDVQPFVALGKVLKDRYGHRVRLATHGTFKNFVEENGLEFFNIGGDPANLMEYMVKNPGLLPGRDSLKHGDVGKRKKEIKQILNGCWRSCIEAGDGMDLEEESFDADDTKWRPFIADAIIANPPGFAHVHCAEKLGIPFHMMFTMPWTPTTAFPHPLANVTSTDTDQSVANFLSYPMVMMLTWQGLGGVINKFRETVLNLDSVSVWWTPIMVSRSKVPFTYCWSPALIPKPADWGEHILIAGFYFLSLASSYTPDPALAAFLEAGPPPVYIGFGSIVVDDPDAMTRLILEAVKKAGVRALVSKGWGGLGSDSLDVPENIFFLGNCPHDWLFKHVSAVVHHGGAGTTAAGIAAGVPTVVVPFFGDQPFWGAMVHKAGAGPPPIPHKRLTSDNLATAIEYCFKEETQVAAKRMGEQIREEKGPELGAEHFHATLPMDRMRCALDDDSAAVWRIRRTETRIGALAAAVLCNEGILKTHDLKPNRTREYDLSDQPIDPISGVLSSTIGTLANLMVGTINLPKDMAKAYQANATPKKPRQGTGLSSPTTLSSAGPSRMSTEIGSLGSSTTKSSGEFGTVHKRDYGEAVRDAAVVVQKDWFTLVNLPREITQSLGKGFHNAPKLYGDTTVRKPDKVTNLRTGLKAGGKQFGLGMYDAVTGLVTQPYQGVKKEGGIGFLKGVGKGIGGLLLKPEAAVIGGIGYAWEGLFHHAKNGHKMSYDARHGVIPIVDQVKESQFATGYWAFHNSTDEQRATILRRWEELQKLKAERERIAKEKKEAKDAACPIDEWRTRHHIGRDSSLTSPTSQGSSASVNSPARVTFEGQQHGVTSRTSSASHISLPSPEYAEVASPHGEPQGVVAVPSRIEEESTIYEEPASSGVDSPVVTSAEPVTGTDGTDKTATVVEEKPLAEKVVA